VFGRRVGDRALDFGVSGFLHFSNLIMYDRQTESWWQQATAEAIVGDLLGQRLTLIPAPIVSWAEFKSAHPTGKVLNRNTGHSRPYGANPYVFYDGSFPFLYQGPRDGRLSPMERVVAVSQGGQTVAFPFSVLEKERVVRHTVGGRELVVFFKKGTASALDEEQIAEGRDVGATNVFLPMVDARALTFRAQGEKFIDLETGSTWNLLGHAVDGPLAGKRLEPVVHGNHLWFSWVAFQPSTVIYRGAP
jgi:hypothetical protein